MKRVLNVAAGVALVCLASAQVSAQSARQVSYDDLDLTSSSGLAQFDLRLARAVNSACGVFEADTLQAKRLSRQCQRDTRERLSVQRELAINEAGRLLAVNTRSVALGN